MGWRVEIFNYLKSLLHDATISSRCYEQQQVALVTMVLLMAICEITQMDVVPEHRNFQNPQELSQKPTLTLNKLLA